jgi:pimeloyl-ACP methyl ester carboxylesterase
MFDFDVEAVARAAADDPAFRIAARDWTADIVFRMGDEPYRLQVRDGEIASFARDRSDAPANVRISGPADAWDKLLMAVPPAPYQDPRFGGQRVGFVVEGELAGAFAPYYGAILEFLKVLRRLRSGPPPERPVPEVARRFDAAVGRYMYVTVAGVQQRIYFEEAGRGRVPLILQHTAGADGRQWRHLLEDPDFQRLFRMISYDLPYHGRSLPPTSVRWWEEEYGLTRDVLIETVLAISNGLGLERPVYMGCSVGGFLAPDLAYYRPDDFRAVVGLNAGLGIDAAKRNRESEASWSHPRVGGQWRAAAMLANTSPKSPEAYRRETGWIYDQGSHTAMTGDLLYYNVEHDLTEAQAAQIDTSKIAVYLLTGEYDQLAYEDGTARLARAIKGSHFQVVPGLGHFGPSENPADFKTALLPLFEEIARLT